MEVSSGDRCELEGPKFDVAPAGLFRNVRDVAEVAEEIVDQPDSQVSLQLKSENGGRKVLCFLDAEVGVDSLDRGLGGVVGADVGFHLLRVRRMSLEQVVDAMVDHVLNLLLLTDHRRGKRLLLLAVHPLDFLAQSFGVVSLGPGDVLAKGVAHDVLVVEEVLLFALVGLAHLIEFADILALDFLDDGEVCAFSGGILEVYVVEVAEIDVHLADGPQ